jgi:hypothetical protein
MKLEDVKEGQFIKPNKKGVKNALDPNFLCCILKIHYKSDGYPNARFSAKYWDSREGGKICIQGSFTPEYYDLIT